MKTQFSVILTLLLALVVHTSYAQDKVISGTISDQSGLPLPGVNIIVKGTTNGTQSDFDGNYTIDASTGDILSFTYVGLKAQEITVGTSNTLNVTMTEDASVLDEVVVTALGISREKKSLGYSTQEVEGDELSTVKSGNFVNALSGRASGVQIKRNNNLGGSTNVVIRGNASLTGSNQALFVIDGVPINNTNTNSAGQAQASGGYYDYGNTASDINPDDIESVNILKGAAASALYGSRAANGVIMITTKTGKKSKGLGVTINSGVTFGSVDKSTFIKYQKDYGAGYGPYYGACECLYYNDNIDVDGDGVNDISVPFTEDGSYGLAFDSNLLIYQWNSFDPDSPNYLTATPWENAANGPITFFETPITTTNSVSIENGMDNGSYRLGYTRFEQDGLLPNSNITKHNFSISGTYKLNEKLTATGYANFLKSDGLGRNSTGYNDNIISNFKQWWQTNVDLKELKDIYFATGRNVTWNPQTTAPGSAPLFWDNPYFQRYENYQNDSRSRFIGNMSLNYELTDWLNITGRIATDTYSELQEERRANGSVPTSFGVPDSNGVRGNVDSGYGRRNIANTETNYDLMLNFDKDFGEKFNLKGILGANIRRNEFQSIYAATSGGLSVPKLYSLQNSVGPLPLPNEQDERVGVDGIYASASLGFDSTIFVDATIRRDHSSTLPKNNSTFYYPSIATSFVFSNLIDSDVISFGKLRASYAEVGNSAPFDFLYDTYNVNIPPGSSSTSVDNVKKNPNLKPENTESIELGLEMRFLKSRLGLDVAVYKTNSVDQIYGVPVSTATGYSSKILNAGEIENKGVEITIFAAPIRNENFSWDMNINWSKNENKVIALADGIDNLQLGNFQGGITLNARVGQPYGVINGTDYTYVDGQRVVDATSGEYIKTSTSDKVIGDINPEWSAGFSNKLTYKNLALSVLIDVQKGGSIFSLDNYYGLATGLYAETSFINDLGNPVRNTLADGGGFINPGVNADGSENTTRIRADRFGAFGYRRGLPDKAFVYDAGFVKLREVALSYSLPQKLIGQSLFKEVTFSVIGSNLWIIDKSLPHADPESGLGSGNLQGYSVGSLPTTRDFAFNVKLKF
ncbi:TonB-linked SusC/RagA family outer membrane protein [Gelidibacter algens]|uniref:TonB-linked SusC/RagA family outer membrane protein n=1 Tax=Gelidibacter algens TaxID=49280 RepID=A0A1A7QXD3_9FLAO|nr:SusC/RagA family TonB-linked outer membrane protein [Gelidibacter algens]OBX24670.1 SusC/RagA family protein [Gelidibacter algens]RAJ20835.1 TonB-linked SusC/RagA family outer membrane protein [Gelidibacter algens]